MKTRMNFLSLLLGTGIVAIWLVVASNTASAQGYYGGGGHGGPSYGGSHHGGIVVQVDRSYHGGDYRDYYGGGYVGRGHCDHRPVVIVPHGWSNPHHGHGYRPPVGPRHGHGHGHFPSPHRR